MNPDHRLLIVVLLLMIGSPSLYAGETATPPRDWLAAPPPATPDDQQPSPGEPRFELFPGSGGIGVPDEHGISRELLEAIRRESERALNPVTDELSTL